MRRATIQGSLVILAGLLYERGPGASVNAVPRSLIDSAWRAVEGIDRG
jgi:hypothetical protein